jgi:hypothetical protein
MGPGRFPLARKRARGAGMTCGKRRDSPCARGVAAKLIPAPPPACHPARVAACDGTWMGPFTNLTWQRPAPGRRANGSRSRRPAVTVAVEASAMARRAATAEEAHGRPSLQRADGSRRFAAGHKSPPRGRRKAAWRPQGLREPDGVPRKACRGLPGRLGPGPGLPTRHPRTRRTPGPRRGRTARAERRRGHHICNDITPPRPPPARCRRCR